MIAREKFTIGDRVQLTSMGVNTLSMELRKRAKSMGTVTGFNDGGVLVSVRPDTYKYATLYHMDFWQRITPALEAKP